MITIGQKKKVIEGAKGCFPAYAKVWTPDGKQIPISSVLIGQKVTCFDEDGELHDGVVTQTVEHVEDVVIRLVYWGGQIDVTPNHWMLNQFNKFVPASSFELDDALVDANGHLCPIKYIERIEDQKVYNLTVSPHHTFICDGIRVHNGGIGHGKYGKHVTGEKGGGKGGGGSGYVPKEAKNTLKSVSTARVLDVISEGEIEGLVDGHKSIFFNDTPVQNADDTYNFTGLTIHTRNGTPDQDYIEGFPAAEAEVAVGVEVFQATPIVRTITDATTSAISVKIRVPSLTKYSSNGDLNGNSVQFKIERQSNGGGYVEMVNTTLNGKTTSPYESSYRVPLDEGGDPWDIRVTRISDDSDEDARVTSQTYWSTYTKIIDNKIQYVDSALVGVEIDAEQFAEQVPSRSYEVKGIKVKIPVNYDPVTREYTGLWNGTFTTAWTNNPAWILYDLLTNSRYGVGSAIASDQVDKFALYAIAQHCDGMVPDGTGGLEPRYVFNGVINTIEEAYKVLNAVASTFRGMLYFSSGLVTATTDKDADPVKLLTPANVIGGMFTYSGASLKSKHSVAVVRYNDPDDAYKSAVVAYENPEAIKRMGWKALELAAYGCTSRGQAYRYGKWYLDTEEHASELVTYKASFDNADLRPGDIIKIADPTYAGVRYGGRLVSGTVDAVTLDLGVELVEGESYSLSVVLPSGEIEEVPVSTVSDGLVHSLLTLGTNLTAEPVNGAMWVLSSTNLEPRLFRVITVTEVEKNVFEVSALIHDVTKYARVEEDIDLVPPVFTLLPTGPLKAPSDLSIVEYLYQGTNGVLNNAITLAWTQAADPRASYYEVEMMHPETGFWEPVSISSNYSVDLLGLTPGAYSFRVRANDSLGQPSGWYTESFAVLGLEFPPADVTGFRINNVGAQSNLTWDHVPDLDLSHYVVKYSSKLVNAKWGEAIVLAPRIAAGATYHTVPTLIGTYMIKAVDKSDPGRESVNETVIISNIGDLNQTNVIETLDETGFPGTKTNCIVDSGTLKLDDLALPGYYYFDNDLDLLDVFTSRVIPGIDANGEDLGDTMDTWITLDQVLQLSSVDPSAWNVRVQVSVSQDTVTWTDWEDVIIGDYTCRAFKFRLLLTSSNENTTPAINSAKIVVDMEDRREKGFDIVTTGGTGIKTITYANPFNAQPSVQISAQDMASGDKYEFTSKTTSGFTIKFTNAANVAVTRTFDWVAEGYGRML